MSVANAPTRRREATRERLLDAAFELYAEQGVHATPVEQVCERAGFTRGAFYSNFSTKEELFAALMDRQSTRYLDALNDRIDELAPVLASSSGLDDEALTEIVLQFAASPFHDRTWALISVEFRLLALRDPRLARIVLDRDEAFEVSLVEVVDQVLLRARRRFVMDAQAAIHILATAYADACQTAMLTGATSSSVDFARPALARLVLALTAPLD